MFILCSLYRCNSRNVCVPRAPGARCPGRGPFKGVGVGRNSSLEFRPMAKNNIEDERHRLGKLYGDMSDGELQEIAKEGPLLTEIARQTLMGQIERRKELLPGRILRGEYRLGCYLRRKQT